MFDRIFVLKIFEGFSIERWNDLVRPFDIIEMDKSAEKTVVAYMIGKMEERRGNAIDWDRIIYGSFFDLLKKIALCDIKAPVQRMIREDHPEEFAKLNRWVVDQYRAIITDRDLLEEFAELARSAGANVVATVTARIDRPSASHYIGSGKVV